MSLRSRFPTTVILQANALGVIPSAAQGGGVGFLVAPSPVDSSGAAVVPGALPVSAYFENNPSQVLAVAGPYAVYCGDFEQLTFTGCTPGGSYLVMIFRDKEQGIGAATQSTPANETLIMTAHSSVVAAITGAFYGPNNPTGNGDPGTGGSGIVAGAFDLRSYRGATMRCSVWNTAGNTPPNVTFSIVEYPTAKAQQEFDSSSRKAGTCGGMSIVLGGGAHGGVITIGPGNSAPGAVAGGAAGDAFLGNSGTYARKPGFIQPQVNVPGGWSSAFAWQIDLVGYL